MYACVSSFDYTDSTKVSTDPRVVSAREMHVYSINVSRGVIEELTLGEGERVSR